MMQIQFSRLYRGAHSPAPMTANSHAGGTVIAGLAAIVFLLLSVLSSPTALADARIADVRVDVPPYVDLPSLQTDASLRRVRFLDAFAGVAVGDCGAVWHTADGGVTWDAGDSGVACRIDDVIWTGPSTLVAVGGAHERITQVSRGIVIHSRDGGRTWTRAADSDLPRLRTIRRAAGNVLVADGDWSHPSLTNQFESRDGGRTWNSAQPDPSPPSETPPTTNVADLLSWAGAMSAAVTTRDLCTVEMPNHPTSRICAVGDHGIIMTSDDRGQTWTARRGHDRRAAVLVVASNPGSVDWAIVGSETLDAGNRVAVLVQSFGTPSDRTPIDVAGQVAAMIGASGIDAFGETPGEDTARQWLMLTRPAAMLIDESLPDDVRAAFVLAATATGVGRIAAYTTRIDADAVHRDVLLTDAGTLASDLQSDAMHWIAPLRSPTRSTSVQYVYDAAPSRRTGESITSGLSLHLGRKRTPRSGNPSRRQLQIVQARLKQSTRIERLLTTSRTSESLSTSLDAMLDQTSPADQFRLAWSVYERSRSIASIPPGYQTTVLDRIADRFGDETAGKYAKLRSEATRRSNEWKHIDTGLRSLSSLARVASAKTVAVSPFQIESSATLQPTEFTQSSMVRRVSAIAPLLVPTPQRLESPLQAVAPERPAVDLSWEFHPLVLLGLDADERNRDMGDAKPVGLKQLAQANRHPWSPLVRDTGRQTLYATVAADPPHLDGVLDDDCWRSSNVTDDSPVRIRITHDRDYVYAAIVCPANQIGSDTMASATKTRDHDLSMVDRMRISIDIDRDLITSMQLQATDARRTHDAIDGNPAWQPTWYVAVDRTPAAVTYEIAIVRSDLMPRGESTDEPPVWFIKAEVLRAGQANDWHVIPDPKRWARVKF